MSAFSTQLIFLGWIFLLIGLLLDRFYYYKLLIAVVEAAENLEIKYDLPAKLSVTLSKAVTRTCASRLINWFYLGGFLIGLGLIFFNLATVDFAHVAKGHHF